MWLSAQIRKDIKKKFRVYYEQGYRRDENLNHLKAYYFEAGGRYKPAKFLWIGTHYRHYTDFLGNYKNRLGGSVIFRAEIDRFLFKSRTRYIAIKERHEVTHHFLREKISLDYNIKNCKVDPFIASELFYHLEKPNSDFEQFRVDLGFEWKIAKRHSLQTYYRYRIKRNIKNPLNSNVIGIEYVLEL